MSPTQEAPAVIVFHKKPERTKRAYKVDAVAYSGDGGEIAARHAWHYDHEFRVYDPRGGESREGGRYELPACFPNVSQPTATHPAGLALAAFGPTDPMFVALYTRIEGRFAFDVRRLHFHGRDGWSLGEPVLDDPEPGVVTTAYVLDAGRRMMAAGAHSNQLLVVDLVKRSIRLVWPARAAVSAVRVSPDDGLVAAKVGHRVFVFDVENPEPEPVFATPSSGRLVNDAAFSPDGRYLVTAVQDGTVRLYDPGNGRELRRYEFDVGVARAIAVSPDGTACAVAGDGPNCLVVFDLV